MGEGLANEINNIAHHLYERETKTANQTFYALAKLDAEAFPNRVYGYNLLGIYYSIIDKKPKLARTNYERALKINVGVVHLIEGNKKEATAAFNKVVALNNDASCGSRRRPNLPKSSDLAPRAHSEPAQISAYKNQHANNPPRQNIWGRVGDTSLPVG